MPQDIVDFLADKFGRELRQHFVNMATNNKIPTDLFRDKPNQEVLARFLLGEAADIFTDLGRKEAFIDGAVIFFMLHILGSDSIAEIIDGGKTSSIPAAGNVEAYAFDIGEEQDPPRTEAPKVLFESPEGDPT